MANDQSCQIREIKERAASDAGPLQPWEGYYRLRGQEMEVLLSLYDLKRPKRILEIGCGNGFNAAILSRFAGKVVATDLSKPDMKSHSVGIIKTSQLFERLNINNCVSVSCSGAELPFKDGTFDFVFCAYTLEHIPAREQALKEVRRVLQAGGEALFVLPTFMHWIFYPLAFYGGLIHRWVDRMSRKAEEGAHGERKEEGAPPARGNGTVRASRWREFRTNYPHFPLPEPHGEYPNYFIELGSYTVFNWLRLFKRSGFRVSSIFSTMLIPREVLMIATDPLKFYERHSWIDKKYGMRGVFRRIGQNVCIVAKNCRQHNGGGNV